MTTLDTQTKEAIKITKEAIKNRIADQPKLNDNETLFIVGTLIDLLGNIADSITDKDYKKAKVIIHAALEPLYDRMNHLIKPEDEFDKKIDMFFNGESELDETNETPN